MFTNPLHPVVNRQNITQLLHEPPTTILTDHPARSSRRDCKVSLSVSLFPRPKHTSSTPTSPPSRQALHPKAPDSNLNSQNSTRKTLPSPNPRSPPTSFGSHRDTNTAPLCSPVWGGGALTGGWLDVRGGESERESRARGQLVRM